MSTEDRVQDHYTTDDIAGRLLRALADAGADMDNLTPNDLAPLDQFHSRGLVATKEVADLLRPEPGEHALDIGCGIGGPARWIAHTFGCQVSGIDLTQAFCDAAVTLNEATGLDRQVDVRQGNALDLPFDDQSFDLAYSQNVVMNIADKAGFYAEAFRVLKPGARLGLSNLALGDGEPPIYPAPWAATAETSFLITPDETRAALQDAGFEIVAFHDISDAQKKSIAAQREQVRRDGPPKLGVHILMGERMKEMQRNTAQNVEEGRVIPIEVLCRRP